MIRFLILFLCCYWSANAQELDSRCLTDELYVTHLEDPEIHVKILEMETNIQNWIERNTASTRETLTIPVVVHVVWNETSENICDEQILSQIDVLNEDFNKQNNNQVQVPDEFRDLIANVGIEFCLAKRNPEGFPTNGITRTHTNVDYIGEKSAIFYTSEGGMNAWDPSRYLNIWLGNMQNGLLGYANMPGTSIAEEDGVVINPKYFGRVGTAANSRPYHLGRVATHEIGHYLNLFHPWSNGYGNCDSDDLVEDTPRQEKSYLGCPAFPQFSCESMDMVVNFMDYVDDDCMAMFTYGQKLRMVATLENYRKELIEDSDTKCNNSFSMSHSNFIEINPNPASHNLNVSIGLEQSDLKRTLTLFDLSGRQIHTNSNPGDDFTICVSDFSNGIYYLVLSTNDFSINKKVIILN